MTGLSSLSWTGSLARKGTIKDHPPVSIRHPPPLLSNNTLSSGRSRHRKIQQPFSARRNPASSPPAASLTTPPTQRSALGASPYDVSYHQDNSQSGHKCGSMKKNYHFDEDNVSEVSLDTAFQDEVNHSNNLHQEWPELLADLKLELAETKASLDVKNMELRQVTTLKQELSDCKDENMELRYRLKEVEKQLWVQTTRSTSSVSSHRTAREPIGSTIVLGRSNQSRKAFGNHESPVKINRPVNAISSRILTELPQEDTSLLYETGSSTGSGQDNSPQLRPGYTTTDTATTAATTTTTKEEIYASLRSIEIDQLSSDLNMHTLQEERDDDSKEDRLEDVDLQQQEQQHNETQEEFLKCNADIHLAVQDAQDSLMTTGISVNHKEQTIIHPQQDRYDVDDPFHTMYEEEEEGPPSAWSLKRFLGR